MARSTSKDVPDPKLPQRQEQLAQIQNVIRDIEAKAADLQQRTKLQKQQDSVSKGLYDEIDKLAKKAPGEHVSELALEQINDLIQQVKELITGDRYIDRIKPFVPAGDMPELRDSVSVLRQIRQGLERFAEDNKEAIERLYSVLKEARFIELALLLYLRGTRGDGIITGIKKEMGSGDIPSKWLTDGHSYGSTQFDFNYLDSLNLDKYFGTHVR